MAVARQDTWIASTDDSSDLERARAALPGYTPPRGPSDEPVDAHGAEYDSLLNLLARQALDPHDFPAEPVPPDEVIA